MVVQDMTFVNLLELVCLARGQCRLLIRKCFLLIVIDCVNLWGHTLKERELKGMNASIGLSP